MVKDEFLERKLSSCPNLNHYFILYQNTGAPFRYSFYSQVKLSRECASPFLTQRMIKGCNGDQQGWSRDRAKGEGLERETDYLWLLERERCLRVWEKNDCWGPARKVTSCPVVSRAPRQISVKGGWWGGESPLVYGNGRTAESSDLLRADAIPDDAALFTNNGLFIVLPPTSACACFVKWCLSRISCIRL